MDKTLSEQLADFEKSLTGQDLEYMMRYDLPCIQDCIKTVKRIENIRTKFVNS